MYWYSCHDLSSHLNTCTSARIANDRVCYSDKIFFHVAASVWNVVKQTCINVLLPLGWLCACVSVKSMCTSKGTSSRRRRQEGTQFYGTGGPTQSALQRTKNLNSKLSIIQHYAVYMCCMPSRCLRRLDARLVQAWQGFTNPIWKSKTHLVKSPHCLLEYVLKTKICIQLVRRGCFLSRISP